MNLVIVMPDESVHHTSLPSFRALRHTEAPEPLVAKLIRCCSQYGITNVYCTLNDREEELYKYLSTENFQIPVQCTLRAANGPLKGLLTFEPALRKAPFMLATVTTDIEEEGLVKFIISAAQYDDVDGILALTRSTHIEHPLCVAMNDTDTILKFSDSKDGYNWAVNGPSFFSPEIFNEMHEAVEMGMETLGDFFRLLCTRGYVLKGMPYGEAAMP